MPQKSRLKLPPLDLGPETIGQRIRRLRKALGLTQVQLAEKMGLLQALITGYERDERGLRADMLARFALALGVSADELLGIQKVPRAGAPADPSIAIFRRMSAIEKLPLAQRKTLLRTIDTFLKGAGAAA